MAQASLASSVSSLRIAHAAGPLGEAQGRAVAAELHHLAPELSISLLSVAPDETRCVDAVESGRAPKTDRLERALQAGLADAVVRCAVDWPFGLENESLTVAVLRRHEPRDALLSRCQKTFSYLPPAATITTSGAHRRAQLLRRRRDLRVTLTSASAETLLAMLDGGCCDAVVVAASEVIWLGLAASIAELIDADLLIPAAGQGTLLVQTLADSPAAQGIAALHDAASGHAVRAEQACMRRLAPPADAAVAVYAMPENDDVVVHGIVAEPDGGHAARLRWRGPMRAAEETGATMAELLLAAGGREILSGLPLESTGRYTFRVAGSDFGRSSDEFGDDEPFPLDTPDPR